MSEEENKTSLRGGTKNVIAREERPRQSAPEEHESRTQQSAPEEHVTNRLPRSARNDDTKQPAALIPQLRFKEFDGEWLIKPLGSVCNHISYGLTVRPDFVECGIPLISAREITSGIVNIQKGPKISQEDFDKLSDKAKPKKGDVFLTKTGTIGLSARFMLDIPIAITQNIAVIRLNDVKQNSALYLIQYFKTSDFYRSAISRVNQSTIMDLQLGDIRKLLIPFAKFPEQQKIASFLSAVDEKIQQLSKKKALLAQYKKGVMQQLFSGALRFKPDPTNETSLRGTKQSLQNEAAFPDWEEKRLGDVCESIKSGKSKSAEDGVIPLYGSTGIIGKCSESSHKGEFILIARVGANAGTINLIDGDFGVSDNTLVVVCKPILIIGYIYYFLDHYNLNRLVFGSGQPLITGGQLKALKLKLPNTGEQQKTANYLSHIDTKIEAVNNQITQTQSFKKGLLQQLFV